MGGTKALKRGILKIIHNLNIYCQLTLFTKNYQNRV